MLYLENHIYNQEAAQKSLFTSMVSHIVRSGAKYVQRTHSEKKYLTHEGEFDKMLPNLNKAKHWSLKKMLESWSEDALGSLVLTVLTVLTVLSILTIFTEKELSDISLLDARTQVAMTTITSNWKYLTHFYVR